MTFYFSLKKIQYIVKIQAIKSDFLFFIQLIFHTFTYSQSRFLQTVLKQKNPALKLRPVNVYHDLAPGILQARCRAEAGTLRVRSASTTPKAIVIHSFFVMVAHSGVLQGHREWVLTSGRTEHIVNFFQGKLSNGFIG